MLWSPRPKGQKQMIRKVIQQTVLVLGIIIFAACQATPVPTALPTPPPLAVS